MNSILVECWNCGQKLNIRVDKLETARCGSCQQMVVKSEQPPIEVQFINHSTGDLRQTTAAREEKRFDEPVQTPQQKSPKPAASRTARLVTAKEMFLGLSISVVIAVILKVITAFAIAKWLLPTDDEVIRQKYIYSALDLSDPRVTIVTIRITLVLVFFFFLSLSQRFARPIRYIISTLLYAATSIALGIFIDRFINYRNFDLINYVTTYPRTNWLPVSIFIMALAVIDLIAQRLLQPGEVKKEDSQWPERTRHTKMGFGIFTIAISALPTTLVPAFFIGCLLGILVLACLVALMGEAAHSVIRPAVGIVIAIIWFFFYKRAIQRGVRALKEGESVLSAWVLAVLEPFKWIPSSK